MIDKSLIGRESEPFVAEVEKNAIRRFAEAIGDPNPIYAEEEAARAAGFPTLVAPPTFAVAAMITAAMVVLFLCAFRQPPAER